MEESRNYRSRVFVIVLLIALTIIFYIMYNSKEQQELLQKREQYYQATLQLMAQSKFSEAEIIFKRLVKAYPDSYIVSWRYATCLSALGKYEEAEKYFNKAQEKSIYVTRDSQFLLQYGELLYIMKQFPKAKVYLQESVHGNLEKKWTDYANKLLNDIQQKGI